MKILIGGTEVCGLVHDLGEEYRKQGHSVITVASSANKFYNYEYTINPDKLVKSFVKHKTKSESLAKILSALIEPFGVIKNAINSVIIRYLLSDTDCYIHVYNTMLWEEERQLRYLKKKDKKIITLFVGSDIRDYFLFKEKFHVRQWDFTEKMNEPGGKAKEKKLRLHEKYSDAIFSVPDQSMLALRPYFHLQIPVVQDKFTFRIPERDIPIVLHAPSQPHFKGSDLIMETLNKLKAEGIKFEIRFLKNMPHNKLLEELTDADVLVDEIILHGPGSLSFEAMLSGCAVATKYLSSSPECFRPPVMNINEMNILEQLRILLTDKDLRIRMAKAGREYALRNNTIKKVAADILSKLNSKEYDYYPGNKN